MLSAKHVTCHRNEWSSYRTVETTSPSQTVYLHTPITLAAAYQQIVAAKANIDSAIPRARTEVQQAISTGLDSHVQQLELQLLLSRSQIYDTALARMHLQIGQTPPVLGTVLCHAPLQVNVKEGDEHDDPQYYGHTEDWVFFETDMTLVDIPHVNAINLRDTVEQGIAMRDIKDEKGHVFSSPQLPEDATNIGYLYAQEPMTVSQLMDEPLAVVKKGAATGITIGRTNVVSSFKRYINEKRDAGGKLIGEWSRELPVFGEAGIPFSEGGDSGATVMCRDGRLEGIQSPWGYSFRSR